ncbi:MAG: dephospho-CoA kinase [Legionella sp.]|nr:dephospho-CoA kinase [Legionella sp.]
MTFSIGLTGLIASGKSTVAELFRQRGVTVINADQIARELTSTKSTTLKKIAEHFGNHILTTTGELNRRALREIIFTEPQERIWLEQLTHPLIRQEIQLQVESATSDYCVVEIPLLVNNTQYPYLNRILLIEAPPEQMISRLMQRDRTTREQALAIINAQPPLEIRRKFAHDFIMNDQNVAALDVQVAKLDHMYRQYAKK